MALAVTDFRDRIRRAVADEPPLRLVILFGSAARGAVRPDSDVDVGIVPRDPSLSLAAELDLQARLERGCGRPVDLVRLDRASTLLRWEAARGGVLVLAEPREEFVRFVVAAALEHADLATTLVPAAGRFQRHLVGAGSLGTTATRGAR